MWLRNQYVKEHMPKFRVTKHEGTFLMWINMMAAGRTSQILAKEYGIALGDGKLVSIPV